MDTAFSKDQFEELIGFKPGEVDFRFAPHSNVRVTAQAGYGENNAQAIYAVVPDTEQYHVIGFGVPLVQVEEAHRETYASIQGGETAEQIVDSFRQYLTAAVAKAARACTEHSRA